MLARKRVGRRDIVAGAAAGVGAAGFLVAGGMGAKAQVPAPGFPLQKLPDSPLVVDVSKIPGALLNEQIPRWIDPISFPQWPADGDRSCASGVWVARGRRVSRRGSGVVQPSG